MFFNDSMSADDSQAKYFSWETDLAEESHEKPKFQNAFVINDAYYDKTDAHFLLNYCELCNISYFTLYYFCNYDVEKYAKRFITFKISSYDFHMH